jgi:3-isopropylmalate/(R)-2-methylmalate dehydratase large subunit
MAQNIIEKIWDEHVVLQNEGHPAILGIDLQLTHEVTSPQGFEMLRNKNLKVKFPGKHLATLDHAIPTTKDRHIIKDPTAKKQVQSLRQNVSDFGVPIFDYGSGHQGIVHVIGPELGITQPGMTIVCGDSHTSTHGAFGALAFGVGSTEVGFVLATGCLLQQKPKTMKVEFRGNFQSGVFSKDAILRLISVIGVGGATGYIIEFTGEAIRNMSMEARMSVCNMSIECGARAGLVSPDEVTFDYLKGRKYAPKTEDWQTAVDYWKSLASDEGCNYDKEVVIDVANLKPMVTWGVDPSQGVEIDRAVPALSQIPEDQHKNYHQALAYTGFLPEDKLIGTPVQFVFLGSCTNARMEDLEIASSILYPEKPFRIKNIVLDLGGVLFHGRYEFLAKITGLNIKEAEKTYFSSKLDTHEVEFWQEIAREFNLTQNPEELLEDSKKHGNTLRADILEFVTKHQGEFDFYYLTNTTPEKLERFKQNPVYKLFKNGMADCEVGLSKPDPEIFKLLLQKFDLEPEKTLFVDDFSQNAEAANKMGMVGIYYEPSISDFADLINKNTYQIEASKVRKIAPNITMYVVPGSEDVKKIAEENGLDKIFMASGADWRMPGCSMCLGMNEDKVPAKAHCLSTSNRNFMNRQGPGAITHLASPATAAATAIAGKIADPRGYFVA